jgi:hypothetical protein
VIFQVFLATSERASAVVELPNPHDHAVATVFLRRTGLAASAAVGILAVHTVGAIEPPTILTCTNLVSGVSWQIRIDFERNTVDSNPARISGTQISWRDATDGGNYTLDRKSGALTVIVASSTGGYFLHDRCEPKN